MLLQIPDVLSKEQVVSVVSCSKQTTGSTAAVRPATSPRAPRDNMQLPEDHEHAKKLGDTILSALEQNPLFMSAALPLKVFPPLFNRYQDGQSFGNHVDNAIRQVTGTPHRVRTDLAATLFFSDPDEYDGGELVVEDTYGVHSVKLPAGHMILYPSSSLHHVRPVTRALVSLRFSGSRAWCATTVNVRSFSILTWPFSV